VSKTLTIRLPDSQDKALTTKAEALGVTRSELVRDLIDRGLDEQPLARNIGHLKGRLALSSKKGSWQGRIRDRNWR
jgi:predicted DNA-binding protein